MQSELAPLETKFSLFCLDSSNFYVLCARRHIKFLAWSLCSSGTPAHREANDRETLSTSRHVSGWMTGLSSVRDLNVMSGINVTGEKRMCSCFFHLFLNSKWLLLERQVKIVEKEEKTWGR